MGYSPAKLLPSEIAALRKAAGMGNDVLYSLCENYPLESGGKEALSAQLWLIGRSYAASPERRRYRALEGLKVSFSNSGDGLDTFFDLLAEKLLADPDKEFKERVTTPIASLNSQYRLDYEEDMTDLTAAAVAVIAMNRCLKRARYAIDANDISEALKGAALRQIPSSKEIEDSCSNSLSFCSKFLHFHAPDNVFILDNITQQHLSDRVLCCPKFPEGASSVRVEKERVEKVNEKLCESIAELGIELSKEEESYAKHCAKEYELAQAISSIDGEVFAGLHLPRCIDNYALLANKPSSRTNSESTGSVSHT